MKKEMVCIICPNSCDLEVEIHDGQITVLGERCKRGFEYAESEMTNPMRTIATSIFVENGEFPLASVRLSKPVAKELIFEIMKQIKVIRLKAPVKIGTVVVKNICGTDSDLIITKNVKQMN
jgi:CxxC motif-containing protein